ncbi:MAG: addiction module protein [Planctomycetota bacterium]|nr:addiction module protein [Planctomycetota bacterium]
MTVTAKQALLRLSPEEKLRLIGELWDSLTPAQDHGAIPGWHRQVVRKRLADHKRHPHDTVPWSKVKRELMKRAKA